MSVSFNTIPSSGVLVPLFYAEMDNISKSRGGGGS